MHNKLADQCTWTHWRIGWYQKNAPNAINEKQKKQTYSKEEMNSYVSKHVHDFDIHEVR